LKREHKQRRRGEIANLRKDNHLLGSRFLNIFSIRSVIRNPLTTLIVDAVTAIAPNTVDKVPRFDPRITSDPIKLIAEIAFVSDISGVCSKGDTRRITSNPRNVASINTNKLLMSESTTCPPVI